MPEASDDALLIAQLREIGDEPCIKLAGHYEQLLVDMVERPDEARERLVRMKEELREKGLSFVDSGLDPLLEHLEGCRRIARSLLETHRDGATRVVDPDEEV